MSNIQSAITHREELCQRLASTISILDAANAKLSFCREGSSEGIPLLYSVSNAYKSIDIVCTAIDNLVSAQTEDQSVCVSFEHLYQLTEQLDSVVSNLDIIAETLFGQTENVSCQMQSAIRSANNSLKQIVTSIH